MSGAYKRIPIALIVGLIVVSGCLSARAAFSSHVNSAAADLWALENIFAWCVVPFDAKQREPGERAEMLQNLGIRKFAYDWREKDIPKFDAEIDALKAHAINLLAWWFPLTAEHPLAKRTLEIFRRHGISPQLWVGYPGRVHLPKRDEKESPQDYELRIQQLQVEQAADQIKALVRLAAPYGSTVALYNHNGWFGMMDNQVAIIERLRALGVTDVGIVYNFSHARDEQHDDSTDFENIWRKIQPHVVAVNVTGMYFEGKFIYPSQGNSELRMMQIIQDSGWRGPVGLIAEKGGDARITLQNALLGLNWLAAEIKQPGSGGSRPFPPVVK